MIYGKKGCIHCELYNGVAMNYKDVSYEIIGDGLEYSYNNFNYSIKHKRNKEDKRFFKTDLLLGNKTSDIRKDIKLVSGNYPEIRSYYNVNIEPCNSLGIKVESCSYDIDM